MIALFLGMPLRPVRTFLAPNDSLGFGTNDYVELVAVLLLLGLLLLWAPARRVPLGLHLRPAWCLVLVAGLPVLLRLALLPRCPPPIPSGSDDFSYILLADTLRHFRLANPAHALPDFFEQMFVLQQPTYSSMYPLGQGLILALGWLLAGHAWAGVLMSVSALCGGCYWMLRAWTSPGWAVAGGVLAAMQFGPLSYWTNSYWGGAVSATAGCLVFGALPRLRKGCRTRDAALLGVGLGLQLLTRPFEFCFLLISLGIFVLPAVRVRLRLKGTGRLVAVVCGILAASAALMCFQNKRVTGSWTTLPYMLSRYQYGVPPSFTFEPNPQPHRRLNAEQDLAYRAQSAIHGTEPETFSSYVERLVFRLRFLRFFLLAPLYIAFFAFVVKARDFSSVWVLLTIAVFLLGSNFFPYFYPHYIAAVTSLFVLISVRGLQTLNRARTLGRPLPVPLGSLVLLVCSVHFVFWFGVYALGNRQLLSTVAPLESWDYINYGDPQGRIAVQKRLTALPGKKLVFVHYAPGHRFEEWVHNDADIDAAAVVWAHDLGPVENQQLLRYYPDRTAWVLEPDQVPQRLTTYPISTSGFQDVP